MARTTKSAESRRASSSTGRKGGSRTSSSARTRKSAASSTRTRNGAGSGSRRKADRPVREPVYADSVYLEIRMIAAIAIAALLLLSVFGLCGRLGVYLGYFLFGMFGVLAYAVPFVFIIGYTFMLANPGSRRARIKLAAVFLFMVMILALITLSSVDFQAVTSISDSYRECGASHSGGGLLGFLPSYPLVMAVGRIGTTVIFVCLLMIFFVMITGRAAFVRLGHFLVRRMDESRMRAQQRREERAIRRQEEEEEWERQREEEEELARQEEEAARLERKREEKEAALRRREKKAQKRSAKQTEVKGKADTAPDEKTGDDKQKVHTVSAESFLHEFMNRKAAQEEKSAEPAPAESEAQQTGQMSGSDTEPAKDSHFIDSIRTELEKPEFAEEEPAAPARPAEKISIHAGGKTQEAEISHVEFPEAGESMRQAAEMADAEEAERIRRRTAGISIPAFLQKENIARPEHQAVRTKIDGNEFHVPEIAKERHTVLQRPSDKVQEEDRSGEDITLQEAIARNAELEVAKNSRAAGIKQQEENRGSEEEETAPAKTGNTAAQNASIKDMAEEIAQAQLDEDDMEDAAAAQQTGKAPARRSALTAQGTLRKGGENAADPEQTAEISVSDQQPVYHYEFPPLELLEHSDGPEAVNVATLRQTAQKLQETFDSFGVGVTVTDVHKGPTVTRYELQPDTGVKVSRIVGLSDDIKLNLAVPDIRIEAPIPGKAAVGIEVPNGKKEMVHLGDLLESRQAKETKSKIAFAVGKGIAGQPVMADIEKMPHLLIAGATGSGKSVCINTIIVSILYRADPSEVKMIMIDPKVVELNVYNDIPHMLIPVVTDPKEAAGALNWAVSEMQKRYRRFAEVGAKKISSYNAKIDRLTDPDEDHRKMPQIVIIIDELADLMMTAQGDVEYAICRIAQLGRAAGIHLVIATQRPSVNVITGLIKANVPSRIAFAVSSGVDSRTILDMNGAEKLLGNGDMLYSTQDVSRPVRLQGAFVSEKEIGRVTDFIKAQSIAGNKDAAKIKEAIESSSSSIGSKTAAPSSERDVYFEEAGRFVIDKDKASIGMLQRVYKIGFNRAARIMDQLCDAGVVGPEIGTKPRQVIMTKEEFEEFLKSQH